MKKIITRISAAALALLLCAGAMSAESEGTFKPAWYLKNIAFLQSNNPNDQEEAALDFFRRAYPNALVLTPEDFMEVNNRDSRVVMIWIHADRAGIQKGWENIADFYTVPAESTGYINPEDIEDYGDTFIYDRLTGMDRQQFIAKLKDLAKNSEVNMYFSGHATQFIEGIDRLSTETPIDIFESNESTNVMTDAPWCVSPWVLNPGHDIGHAGFAAYGHPDPASSWTLEFGSLVPVTMGNYQDQNDVYPMLGPDGVMYDNNNCMWSQRNVHDFNLKNNSVVQGTWGQEKGYDVPFGFVEFLRDNQKVFPEASDWGFNGHIVVNGIGACQWKTAGDVENRWHGNLENMTFNTINYLSKLTDFDYVTTGVEDVEATDDTDSEPEYYSIDGVKVVQPASKGVYIKKVGNKVSKVLVR